MAARKASSVPKRAAAEAHKALLVACETSGVSWGGEPVRRSADGSLVFGDAPEFRPNKSPAEVLRAGAFGGGYFRPIYSSVVKRQFKHEAVEELPADWLKGVPRSALTRVTYTESENKYGVKCGASLEEWETSGWITNYDPYGWFQWYCRFYQGRRCPDDERQIGRWCRCTGPKGRWKTNLLSKIVKAGADYDDPTVSPVVRQTLLHWGYEVTDKDVRLRRKQLGVRAPDSTTAAAGGSGGGAGEGSKGGRGAGAVREPNAGVRSDPGRAVAQKRARSSERDSRKAKAVGAGKARLGT